MLEKRADRTGSAIVIAIVVAVVVAIAALVLIIAGNNGDQTTSPAEPEESGIVPPSLPPDAELPVDLAFEQLRAAIADPDLSWPEKADAWADYLYEVGPTPDECQQLPPGDSSFFAAIQPVLDRREYSPDIRVFLEEWVAIATEYDVLDNEWSDTPEAVERGAQLMLRHGAEILPNDEGVMLCLYGTPQPLQLPTGGWLGRPFAVQDE